MDSLTPREVQVLDLLKYGLSNQQIADTLCLSVSTIKTHIHHILMKLDVPTRYRASALAEDLGEKK